jgi:hypothetical protein
MYDPHLERRLTVDFNNGLSSSLEHWEETDGKDGSTYSKVLMHFHELCSSVSRQREQAYPIAASLVKEMLCCDGVPRKLRSIILLALARWYHDHDTHLGSYITGRAVSHFAEVLNLTAQECAEVYVQWFEDIGYGIRVPGSKKGYWMMLPQPTRVMRGILFDARLQNNGMNKFWRLAAESKKFPKQLFTDPGDNERWECYLTTAQLRQMGSFIALAPEVAVKRFAKLFGKHVHKMNLIVYAKLTLPGGTPVFAAQCDKGDRDILRLFGWLGLTEADIDRIHVPSDIKIKKISVTDADKKRIVDAVIENVRVPERRLLAKKLLRG